MVPLRYIPVMHTAVLVILALVVALVAIDAIARLDERRPRQEPEPETADERLISTQKIIVDLTKRR
jgi:hypothetical protein